MTVTPTYPIDYDGELDLTPFVKHNWKTTASRDEWRPVLAKCRSAHPLVELLDVADEDTAREVVVINRSQLRDAEYTSLLAEHGLSVETRLETAFIGADKEAAEAARAAHADGDKSRLKELRGVPECCIEFHEDHPHDAANPQPLYEVACNSPSATEEADERGHIHVHDPEPMLNVFWQYLGYQFISHVPCSFECEASATIAREHGAFYRDLGLDEEAERLWEFLATPATWTGFKGVSNIRNGYLVGSTNTPAYWSKKTVVLDEEHADKLL